MKMFKKFLKIFMGLVVALFLFFTWYQYRYSMDIVKPYNINSPILQKKLLIATQGSEFKDEVTASIVNHYESHSIFIKVVDVADLENIDPNDFKALVVIHTWENWKPPAAVKVFIDKTQNYKDKIVVLTTSGEGSYKMENVDAIVSESILVNAPEMTEKMVSKLTVILDSNE